MPCAGKGQRGHLGKVDHVNGAFSRGAGGGGYGELQRRGPFAGIGGWRIFPGYCPKSHATKVFAFNSLQRPLVLGQDNFVFAALLSGSAKRPLVFFFSGG